MDKKTQAAIEKVRSRIASLKPDDEEIWVEASEVEKFCTSCAASMKEKGISRVRSSALLEKFDK